MDNGLFRANVGVLEISLMSIGGKKERVYGRRGGCLN